MRRSMLAPAVAALLAIVSCQSADPRRNAAERFIDALFVRIDQPAARRLATGLAVSKIDEEIRLKDGQTIDESTRQPNVTYRFVHADAAREDAASLVYDLRVSPDDADAFTRRLILTLRPDGSDWKVSNYTLEAPAAPE